MLRNLPNGSHRMIPFILFSSVGLPRLVLQRVFGRGQRVGRRSGLAGLCCR